MIRPLLVELNIISEETIQLFSQGTRDNPSLAVFRDSNSGVIFIDDFYVGDSEYSQGSYKMDTRRLTKMHTGIRDYTASLDLNRRITDYSQFYVGKTIVDFGCGTGAFLRHVHKDTIHSYGVELQDSYRDLLASHDIHCYSSIESLENNSIDTIFLFHSFEHLPDPLEKLKLFRQKLKPSGKLIIEVPHANDFLISYLKVPSFIDFTLWSQHLILHTRYSLQSFLNHSGFTDITISGVQRFPLSNHLKWLLDAQPGGHQSTLSLIDNQQLTNAYTMTLAGLDATDTLLAVATLEQ